MYIKDPGQANTENHINFFLQYTLGLAYTIIVHLCTVYTDDDLVIYCIVTSIELLCFTTLITCNHLMPL